jgi:hypothetical protein
MAGWELQSERPLLDDTVRCFHFRPKELRYLGEVDVLHEPYVTIKIEVDACRRRSQFVSACLPIEDVVIGRNTFTRV